MSLRLNGSTSGYVEIDAPATAGSNTLTLPDGNGTSGQYLQTNGSGGLSWAASTEYQGPAFHAYTSGGGTTSLTASTFTKVTLDAETFDTDGNFDSTTNYRFTPTKAGYYVVTGQVKTNWNTTQWSNSQVAIYKNGSEASRNQRFVYTGTSDFGSQLAHHVIAMNGSTDYLELYYWSNAVGPVYNQGSSNTWFFGYWVREL